MDLGIVFLIKVFFFYAEQPNKNKELFLFSCIFKITKNLPVILNNNDIISKTITVLLWNRPEKP